MKDLSFQLYSSMFLLFLSLRAKSKIEKPILWLCDPIMFPLVICGKGLGYKVIWDHHELPPAKFLNIPILRSIFRFAYKVSDINIHANNERMDVLENRLVQKAKNYLLMSNLPESFEPDEIRPTRLSDKFDTSRPFIYLQNSYSESRCGNEIMGALVESDINVVCAGNFSEFQEQFFSKNKSYFSKKVYSVGYISKKEMNWLLSRCLCTIILYRNSSWNQWYCDPNRLYHSMIQGTNVITGSNPTIIGALKEFEYNCAITLDGDGANQEDILQALNQIRNVDSKLNPSVKNLPLWKSYRKLLLSKLLELRF
ncbi:hypothetical protein LFREDSHE_33180 [Shewanella baltica]